MRRSSIEAYLWAPLCIFALGLVLGTGFHLRFGEVGYRHSGLGHDVPWLIVGAGLGLGAALLPSRWTGRVACAAGAVALVLMLSEPWLNILPWHRVAPAVTVVFIVVLSYASPAIERASALGGLAWCVAALLVPTLILGLRAGPSAAMVPVVVVASVLLLHRRGRQVVLAGSFLLLMMAPMLWRFALLGYQRMRILTWLEPGLDPLGGGYATLLSRSLIRDGGLSGQGCGAWAERARDLPTAVADLPLSVLAYDHGWFVGAVLASALCIPIVAAAVLFRRVSDLPSRAVAAGVGVWWGATLACSIGASMGLLPLTAIALPLVSPGGSATIAACVSLGLLARLAIGPAKAAIEDRGASSPRVQLAGSGPAA